ncbi:MAG: pyridoxamine 5'-phosphate oxidase [Rhodothermales bacterium]|nr:pyridoxamine 5'-phosphate oxidase [Rhodothermales bacterium]
MNDTVASLRQEYGIREMTLDGMSSDPIEQFREWFQDCRRAKIVEPNAMTLSTVGPGGRPSSRMVLLKGFDERGFTFFTNYESRKGRELDANPQASLVFCWQTLERQIRIEGNTERLGEQVAEEYFQSRPRETQLGARASPQSEPLESRQELEDRYRLFSERYPHGVPRPEHWGGYLLRPDRVEFWQGRSGRLHDRILYRRAGDVWETVRLAP